MTQEDKELLLKDLCTRLPYRVQGFYKTTGIEITSQKLTYDIIGNLEYKDNVEFKPYLFPLSSMTDGQKTEWDYIDYYADHHEAVDWLNKNHFDYRGLIDMGLALNATDKNIY